MPEPIASGQEGWEGLDHGALTLRWAAPAVHLYGSVGSTSDAARALAEVGAPAGTVVLADAQRRGRGRAGRSWASPSGRGVWLSMVLRPCVLTSPRLLPVLIGIRLAARLERLIDVRVELKWPNDLMAGGRKLGGVLCEAIWEGASPSFVIAGVGLNVRRLPVEGMAGWSRPVSMDEVAGRTVDRLRVADAVVETLSGFAMRVPERIPSADLAEFAARDALEGARIRVIEPTSEELISVGHARGIDEDGHFLIRNDSGTVEQVEHGSVRPMEEQRV